MGKYIDLTSSIEDYLEKILEIEEENGTVRVTDVANKLKIAKPSVNQALTKLKKQAFITQETYGPIKLTEEGKKIAINIKKRHVKLRQFLIDVLKVKPEIAEIDACKMEHAISSHTMEKLTDYLCSLGIFDKE